MESSAMQQTNACDRRLSRAARQVLMEQVVPVLKFWMNEKGQEKVTFKKNDYSDQYHQVSSSTSSSRKHKQTTSLAPSFLWEILDRTAIPSCPLRHDVYRIFEEQSLVGAPLSSKFGPRRTYRSWFHCGICGKVFTSQFYLDRHQHNKHSQNETLVSSSSLESTLPGCCFATSVCEALGGCDPVALDLEPAYGPGSGPGGPDAKSVKRGWALRIEKCDEKTIENDMKPKCLRLMQECFHHEPSLLHDLQSTLCEPLSCHALMHRQAFMHKHLAKSLWNEMLEEGFSQWRVLTVMILLFVYYVVAFGFGERGSHGGGRRRGLLQKQSQKQRYWPWKQVKKKTS